MGRTRYRLGATSYEAVKMDIPPHQTFQKNQTKINVSKTFLKNLTKINVRKTDQILSEKNPTKINVRKQMPPSTMSRPPFLPAPPTAPSGITIWLSPKKGNEDPPSNPQIDQTPSPGLPLQRLSIKI